MMADPCWKLLLNLDAPHDSLQPLNHSTTNHSILPFQPLNHQLIQWTNDTPPVPADPQPSAESHRVRCPVVPDPPGLRSWKSWCPGNRSRSKHHSNQCDWLAVCIILATISPANKQPYSKANERETKERNNRATVKLCRTMIYNQLLTTKEVTMQPKNQPNKWPTKQATTQWTPPTNQPAQSHKYL